MSDDDIQIMLEQFRHKMNGKILLPNNSPLWSVMADMLRAAFNMGVNSVIDQINKTVTKK